MASAAPPSSALRIAASSSASGISTKEAAGSWSWPLRSPAFAATRPPSAAASRTGSGVAPRPEVRPASGAPESQALNKRARPSVLGISSGEAVVSSFFGKGSELRPSAAGVSIGTSGPAATLSARLSELRPPRWSEGGCRRKEVLALPFASLGFGDRPLEMEEAERLLWALEQSASACLKDTDRWMCSRRSALRASGRWALSGSSTWRMPFGFVSSSELGSAQSKLSDGALSFDDKDCRSSPLLD
mmetsp:Transcript_12992/g.30905  ORF Transcript_12992/g.30905 Transcript_12992/m.30905 type:complete len:245 (+) Transcript_12992:700-1434(+)